ncbi:hypothetical protein SAMN04487944_12924 [Gracilibacillus ureilyticus]|uniref:ABC-2 type transport system permease protein n=1 Tax=Gracilibacillus ureilyticus TaxID=531814 RepID=A0A1H9VXR8_9BACI|nr:hypothetical protein [Gracilibacillus ureilyticus]SES26311.1 hypothetical protein SAMN04487944_12924 [Gracilibacillus ureilyticus]
MVTRELEFLIYTIKAYKSLYLMPLILAMLIIFEFVIGMEIIAERSLVLVLFPLINLPILSVMSIIGSLEQKELFITLPISHWKVGFLRPFAVSFLISILFSGIVAIYVDNTLLVSVFSSSLLYLSITTLLITILKHAGLGLGISLSYLMYGLFTTGSGQGPLYLTQWYRPRVMSSENEYIIIQLITVLITHLITVICIKYRSQYHLT